jgi:MFS family permease
VMPVWGWRGVFFVGVLPALFTLWIQNRVEEPAMWKDKTAVVERGRFSMLFEPRIRKVTVAIALMNSFCLFAWWGLNGWVPGYLRLPPAQGGIGLSSSIMSMFVIAMQVGMWFGYVTFGFLADAIGRKRTYVLYLIGAAILLPTYGVLRAPAVLLVLGPFVAFFGTGYFSATTSAGLRAPPRRTPSAGWQRRAVSAWRSPSRARRSFSRRSCGSGSPRRVTRSSHRDVIASRAQRSKKDTKGDAHRS